MRGRFVDRIHHVVERAGQRVDVFAIERGHERAVQALDDLVGQVVALVLDLLDLVCFVPDRRSGAQHLLEQRAPRLISLGHRHEIVVKTVLRAESA